MNKEPLLQLIKVLLFGVLSIIGLIVLLNSVDWGKESVNHYLQMKMGGSMDTSEYQIMMKYYISSYKLIGSILLILSGYFFLRNIEKFKLN
ncbi:hypothetical protein MUG84_26900 [Paenibacillus sp. KQZ6P-2]|uniref:Uncharacterized protein n=1 Tax=Paenibacillus mangrovi TaxID=2931978 RepID=A0A9X2B533_9BACL|nr:hypothetical protein [Paenibacillus mangrovi]MCJ8015299.1 hypothetical protein [Paenibacillus mangrovi]